MNTRLVIASGIAAIAAISTVSADNWPHWRGPWATGVSPETGLPERWSDTKRRMEVAVRGLGISSPVVWGDHVFVTSQIGRRRGGRESSDAGTTACGRLGRACTRRRKGGAAGRVPFLVTALNRQDGRKVWEHEVPAEGQLAEVHDKHTSRHPARSRRERVVAMVRHGQIVALA